MPIYEFCCKNCGEEFEELVMGTNPEVRCPKCKSNDVVKKMSAFAFKSGCKFVPSGGKGGGSCSGCTSSNCSSCGL